MVRRVTQTLNFDYVGYSISLLAALYESSDGSNRAEGRRKSARLDWIENGGKDVRMSKYTRKNGVYL